MSLIKKFGLKLLGVSSVVELAKRELSTSQVSELYRGAASGAQVEDLARSTLTKASALVMTLDKVVGAHVSHQLIEAAKKAEELEGGFLKRRSHVHRLVKELAPDCSKSATNLAVELACAIVKH
jgi:hypothetical protein